MTIEILPERTVAGAKVRDCDQAGDAHDAGPSLQDAFAKSESLW
jgi:hypothetical protein